MGIANATLVSNVDAANTTINDTWDAISGVADGVWSLASEDMGQVDGTHLDVGFNEDLSVARTQRSGESKRRDGARAYSALYEVETVYKNLELGRLRVQQDPSGRTARLISRFVEGSADIMEEKFWEAYLENRTGPDGTNLLSTAHPNGPGGATQSNKTTDVLSHASYRAGKAAMRKFARENGKPFSINPTHLIVNPDEEDIAREVTGADKPLFVNAAGAEATASVVTGTSIANVYAGDCLVVVTPYQTSGDWQIKDLSKPGVRPWVHGFANPFTPHTIDTMDSDRIRDLNVLEWLIQGDVAQGPGHWQCVYGKMA